MVKMKAKNGTKYWFGESFKGGNTWFKRIVFEIFVNNDAWVENVWIRINNTIKELGMKDCTMRVFNQDSFGSGLIEVAGKAPMNEKEIAQYKGKINQNKEKAKQNKQKAKSAKLKALAKEAQKLGFTLMDNKYIDE